MRWSSEAAPSVRPAKVMQEGVTWDCSTGRQEGALKSLSPRGQLFWEGPPRPTSWRIVSRCLEAGRRYARGARPPGGIDGSSLPTPSTAHEREDFVFNPLHYLSLLEHKI